MQHLRHEWDDVVAQVGGSVYMTYDWVRVWWEVYGSSAELRVFVFSAGERVVAVLPIYIDTIGYGPLRLRVARLVGANIPPKVFNPPVPELRAAEIYARVLRELFLRDGCDVFSCGPVSELQLSNNGLQKVSRELPALIGRFEVARGVYSAFDLPEDVESYYRRLRPTDRKHRRYELKRLAREFDVHVDIVSDPQLLPAEFERFVEQHTRQWVAERRPGHFGAWPRALDFHRALVRAQGALGRVRFIRLLAEGKVIASQYVFAFDNAYYWELPSRAVGPAWNRFSLGSTAAVTLLERAIAERVTRVEGGIGHYDYKVRLGASEYNMLTFRIVAPGLASRLRLALFSPARAGIRFIYHRLWYRRIAPLLPPAFWRPQWGCWLRLDF